MCEDFGASGLIWEFPKIMDTLGIPIIRTIVLRVYIGVPLFWEITISTLPLQVFCGVGLGQ